MSKITDQTTLGELAIRRAKLGIETITIVPGPKNIDRTAYIRSDDGLFTGGGPTEAEALDQAFARLEAFLGVRIHREQKYGRRPNIIERKGKQ